MAALLRHKLVAAVVVVLLIGAAVVTAAVLGVGPQLGGDADGPASSPTTAVPPPTGPGLDLRTPSPAPAVLAAAGNAPPVSGPRLRRQVAAALRLPGLGSLGFAVSQLGSSHILLQSGKTAVTPASTLKLLTTTAALAALGPDDRFTTSVVRARAPGTILLVGGGDPLLSDKTPSPAATDTYPQAASLQRLAAATARQLAADGVHRVRLDFDDSLFTGPAVNPRWPATYIPEDVVSPISALWVDEGRTTPGLAERSADPALDAAVAFADRLEDAGVTVTGSPQRERLGAAHPTVLATVSSPPLGEIVEHILETSDNEGAEVLLRQLAVQAGKPGSSAQGVAALRRTLTGLGLDVSGAVLYDGSGLSRQDVVPVRLLTAVVQTAAAPAHPDLRSVITGLPVAGFNGSLGYRFDSSGAAAAGLGYVRAKTGTLTGVHGLAGLAITRTGQVLVFVAIADRVPVPLTLEARDDLDELAGNLGHVWLLTGRLRRRTDLEVLR